MPDADGYGCALGNCGDCIEIWLRVKNEHIAEATFWTDGCGATVASGSMVTELTRGKTALEAMRINQSDVLAALDGLPSENEHCAQIAANALKDAIKDYLAMKNESWKKAYRKR